MKVTFEVTGRSEVVLEFIQYSTGVSKEEVCIKIVTDLLEDKTAVTDVELQKYSAMKRNIAVEKAMEDYDFWGKGNGEVQEPEKVKKLPGSFKTFNSSDARPLEL